MNWSPVVFMAVYRSRDSLLRLKHSNGYFFDMGDPIRNQRFDAIVIGSGMSGGWAAKEFTEKGFKTLVLERGREVRHMKDYPTTNMMPWEFEHRGDVPYAVRQANPVVSRCYAYREDAMHFFVKDTEHPYVQGKAFRLDPGLSGGWQIDHVGPSDPALERF
ncbi:hypothetical protein ACQ86N_40250 [Puia sp. P3]|uniref:hypothetical protein n=1 Tax=Puia sp. P3 TaxID=3423952 RepID=UPI003D665DB4